ncbi:hypothetical protein ABGB17_30410 [Sphaerisporangium sp. B11E5]
MLVVAFLAIGMIFCGTHLFVHTPRRLFPTTVTTEPAADGQDTTDQADQPTPAGREDIARIVYGIAPDLGMTVGRDRLAKACQISSRTAGRIRTDVEVDREEEAARQTAAQTAQALPPASPAPVNGPGPYAHTTTSGGTP